MTYFNRSFVLKERHVEHFNFPHLFTNESTVNEVTEGLKLNLHEIVRNAFDISCQYTEGFIPNMLEIDTINIDFNYVTDEKKYGPIDSIIRKFTSKEKQYYRKPSEKRQEKRKKRALVLRRLQRDNDDNRGMGGFRRFY